MARKATNGNGTAATVEPITVEPVPTTAQQEFNPFDPTELDRLLDCYGESIAAAKIREELPQRVQHHLKRLLTSTEEADRQQLWEILKSAKISIAFAVFHTCLQYAKEGSESRIGSTDQASLPSVSSNNSEAT